jgi:uncharacterized protein involved in exopolysaccharide biosynthesis
VNRSADSGGAPRRDERTGWRGERPQYVVTPVVREDDPFGWAVARDYIGFVLRAPRRHWVLAIASFVIVVSLALVAARIMPVRWQVQATVLAQRNPLMNSLTNPTMSREWDSPTRAAREIVTRRENLIALAKQTNFVDQYLAARAPVILARDWVFQNILKRERTREELEEGLVDTLVDRIWISTGPEGTITFTFVWSDRQIAFNIVKAALQSFLDERYQEEIKAVNETIAILKDHDDLLQKDIAQTVGLVEEKERALRARVGAGSRRASAPAVTLPPVQRPSASADDQDLPRAQVQLESRRRAYNELEDFRRNRLSELQTQLAQQRGVYAEDHPALQGTRQAIESLSQPSPQANALHAEILDLEKDLARHRASSRAAAAALAPLPSAAGPAPVDEYAEIRMRLLNSEDPRLELERRRLDDLLRQHASLVQRIDAARVEMDTAEAAFKYRYNVIQPPQLPRKPLKPYGLLFIVGGLLGGLGMAFFVAALADLRGGRVVERWQVERAMDLPILGEIRR